MDGQAIITVSAAVVALVQLIKWAGLPDKLGPLVVLSLAVVGVAVWAYSQIGAYQQDMLFGLFAGWIAVATSAAGVFGFARASVSAVTAVKPPPAGGAGSEPTIH